MSEEVDAGFDDVLAGNIYVAPEDKPAPAITIRDDVKLEPHTCANATGGTTCDICFGPVTATVTTLTTAGVQAAKALVALPTLKPSDLARLARDIAMDIKERTVVLKDHGLTDAQYDFLEAYNDFYKQALHAACIEWHAPLSTPERIKVEAAAILEDSLVDLGARMRNKAEGLPGVVEAAKLFAKVAGVGERETSAGAPGERFTINIDLGGDQKITVASAPPAGGAAQQPAGRALSDDTKT